MTKFETESTTGVGTSYMSMCMANGCPCRGTVNMGGGWCCGYHGFAESKAWPGITAALNSAPMGRILDAMRELRAESGSTFGRYKVVTQLQKLENLLAALAYAKVPADISEPRENENTRQYLERIQLYLYRRLEAHALGHRDAARASAEQDRDRVEALIAEAIESIRINSALGPRERFGEAA